MEYYSAMKKNKIMPFAATWMELDFHTEWSTSERERQIPYDITYIWNLIHGTNEPFHRKEIHGHGEQTCGCQGGGGRKWWTGNLGLIDANSCLWYVQAMGSCHIALGTMSGHLWWSMTMWEKRIYTRMCDRVTLLCSRKLTEHCKSAIMEKIKIILKWKENDNNNNSVTREAKKKSFFLWISEIEY